MIVIGAEFVLNFLLGIYRPRRPGEIPRPAMDSRILGFAAAPDRIAESIGGALNYQFGFDVTGSWFYQLLSRSFATLIVVGVLVLWALTSVTIVRPNEQGLRIRFGRNITETQALRPGPYLKLPWPFERIERFQTEQLRRVNLGGEAPTIKTAVLWTNDHKAAERMFIVQPEALEREAGLLSAGDRSLIAAEIPLYYTVSELAEFNRLAAPEDREKVIRAEGQRELMRFMATRSVDELLGSGRAGAAAEIQRRMREQFKDRGINVVFVGIEGVHPPRETAEKFEEVVSAGQRRESAIENGEREAEQMLIEAAGSLEMARSIVEAIDRLALVPDPAKKAVIEAEIADLMSKAGGAAAVEIITARRQRWEMHMDARARAEQHAGEIANYEAAPSVYIARKYFDALQELIKDKRVYIVNDDSDGLEVRVDLHDAAIGGNLFENPTANQQNP
jgi:regulator of protease activity HflC (stomatin/prohibitin superfamily)